MLICCLQYAWTYVIARHGIQLDSVQWDHKISMVGYHNHVSTASSQRDCVSQSTPSHGNLAYLCGKRFSYHHSTLCDTRHSATQDTHRRGRLEISARRSLAFNFAPRNSTQATERHENRTMDMDWEFTSVKRWLFAKGFIEDGTRTKTS